jgi:hypothetical protein
MSTSASCSTTSFVFLDDKRIAMIGKISAMIYEGEVYEDEILPLFNKFERMYGNVDSLLATFFSSRLGRWDFPELVALLEERGAMISPLVGETTYGDTFIEPGFWPVFNMEWEKACENAMVALANEEAGLDV